MQKARNVTELLVLQPSDSPIIGFWSEWYMPHAEGEEDAFANGAAGCNSAVRRAFRPGIAPWGRGLVRCGLQRQALRRCGPLAFVGWLVGKVPQGLQRFVVAFARGWIVERR